MTEIVRYMLKNKIKKKNRQVEDFYSIIQKIFVQNIITFFLFIRNGQITF